MSLFTINKEKCRSDGACAAVCPRVIITMENNTPTPAPKAEELCINCGHCAAVCPHDAFSLNTMPADKCAPLKKDWRLTPGQIEHFFKGRRSIRRYNKDLVEKEKLEKLIDIARYAPSGINLQPVRWLVIQEPKEVQRLAAIVIDWMQSLIQENHPAAEMLHMRGIVKAWESGIDFICRGAPHIIIAYGLAADMTAPASCTIALSHLELAASAFNLGACWAGYFHMAATSWPPMQEALGLNKRMNVFGAMLIGYPQFEYKKIPLRNDAQIKWG
ncbi:MAG: nitroreductase family protein [Candidatus Omnitrophota bacterium]